MQYTEFTYLFPPRPEQKIPQGMLPFYQNRGYVAQVKKNGTCTLVFARGDEVIFKTRHPDLDSGEHRMWQPKPEHVEFFQGSKDWNVYVCELVHSKTPHMKDQLYIFDIIVSDGEHLVDTTFESRQDILRSRFPRFTEEDVGVLRLTPFISMAKNFKGGFAHLFTHLKPEDEGVVLKDPKAKLKACFKEGANGSWQVKSRVPTKNYGF